MMSRILVTGGTGTLGRHVVRRLQAAGWAVRVLGRCRHEAGEGIEYAGKSVIARDVAARYGLRLCVTDDVMPDHARRSAPEDCRC